MTDESDGSFTLELFNAPAGVTFANGANVLRTTGFVLDDDGPLSNLAVQVSDPVLVETDLGKANMNFDMLPFPAGHERADVFLSDRQRHGPSG